MIRNTLFLAILLLLFCLSEVGATVCKTDSYDELVCIPDHDSFESLERDCCNSLSLISSSLPHCRNFFTRFNLISPHQLHTSVCESGAQVKIYRPNYTQDHIRSSRMLYYTCDYSAILVSLNIYTVIIMQANQNIHPIFLNKNQDSITSFSTFSEGTYSNLYKYTSNVSVIKIRNANYRVLYLEPGSIRRQCYPNTSFSGTPSISDTLATGTVNIPGATQIGCLITSYILPTQDSTITASITSDGTTNMWISNVINLTSPMKSCSTGECILTTNVLSGTPYIIYITITKPANSLDISSFILNYTGTLYIAKYTHTFNTIQCTNFVLWHDNKPMDGFYYCPPDAYKCNLMNSENKDDMNLIPKYCTSSSWSGNVFSCTTCVENASVVNGICTCNPGFAENHPEGKCLANQYKVEVNLYRESSTTLFDAAMLIITNDCTQMDNNFFCKESGTSNILSKSIITEFSPKDSLNLSASAYLVEGSYSITINYLKRGGLLRECFTNIESPGYRISSTIANFTNPPTDMCIWEGFIKAPEFDIDLYVLTLDVSHTWIWDYNNLAVINTWYSSDTFTTNLVKDKLYYIRVKYINTIIAKGHWFKWRKIGTSTWTDFTSDDMYYPTRPIWNILHATSLSDTLNIVSHDSNLGVYYCPLRCNTCTIKLNGEYSCNTCRGNLVVVNSDCNCLSGFVLDSQQYECIECPSLCKRCSILNNQFICDECFDNARLIENECICTKEYPIISNNQCIETNCQIPISLYNTANKIIILESSEECLGANSYICEGINPNQKRYTTTTRALPYIDNYYFSVISLNEGGLLYQTSSLSQYQVITGAINLPDSGSVTLSGYILSTLTGKYSIRITYNSSTTVLIQDDTYRQKLFTASTFDVYFTQGEFYYIKIQLNEVAASSLNIELSTNNGVSYTSASNNLYYPILTVYSPMLLTSCNIIKTLPALDTNTGIQHCPDICAECNQRIFTSSTTSISCTDCVDRAILSSGLCSCETGTVFNIPSKQCRPINIDRCISYNDMLKCTECSTRYIVGCDGDCCECDHGYVKVVVSPIECILPITNCEEYTKLDSIWICAKCKIGMRVDPYGKCLDCDEGFSMVANDPFTCAVEILGCIKYIETGLDWSCSLCRSGFRVGCEGNCCECDYTLGYIEVSSNPITCIKRINNCILYEKYESIWGCGECEAAFQVDMEKQCNLCNDDYYKIKEDPIVCITKIQGCEEYLFSENEYKCEECEFGYIICNGECCECNPGYYLSREQPDKCTPCPDKCSTCKLEEDSVNCMSCVVPYTQINDRCECDPEDFYMLENECISKPFELSISYQENAVFLSFSKLLSSELSLNEITITFQPELDKRLLKYFMIPLHDRKEYMIDFSFEFNIQASFQMTISFSDNVTDRRNNKLRSSFIYTRLPLVTEGITSRSEYCDKSCKECEIVNGTVTCVECYNFARISEGVCKCYDEVGTDPQSCPISCPDNMKTDTDKNTCIECEECDLNSYDENTDNNSSYQNVTMKTQSESMQNITSFTTKSILAVSSGASILNSNPTSFLRVLNAVQQYRYMLLVNATLPERVKSICQGFDNLGFIPNIAVRFLDSTGVEMSEKYKEFGVEKSDFIINSGKQIFILSILVTIYVILKLINQKFLHKIKQEVLRKVFIRCLSMFEYGAFIGFWLEGYLDFLFLSGLNIIHPLIISSQNIASLSLSVVFMILTLISPIALSIFYLKNIERLSEQAFSSKWGLFYASIDFYKEYAIFEMIYFLVRRILLATSILVLSTSPYIQISVISISSFSILIFYIHLNPCKDKRQRFLAILSEGCFFLVVTSILSILKLDYNASIGNIIDWSISTVIYISMVVPFLIDLFEILKKLYQVVFRRYINLIGGSILRTDLN